MNLSKTLFGGALACAGLTANAQQFIYSATDTSGAYSSFAYSYAYGGTTDISYDSGNLNTASGAYSAYFGGLDTSTSQTATSMNVQGTWDGTGIAAYGYGGNLLQQFFTVSQDAQLLISWDFSGTDLFAQALVLEDPGLGSIFTLDGLAGDPAAGSTTIDVVAGQQYGLVMGLNAGFFPFYFDTATQFINVQLVPAPGAVALFGGAGLLAARRRR